ncbi:MAG: DUF2157 domain-containing protein [Deltaproteobacteria bacterium]|nr:DUF2157 domain-containing protein [Deltaproteobacteria bacterium]
MADGRNDSGAGQKAGDSSEGRKETARLLKGLYQACILSKEAYVEGLAHFRIIPGRQDWTVFFRQALPLAGVLCFFAGLLMFQAGNWPGLGRCFKFVLLEAVFACSGVAALTGRDRRTAGLGVLGAVLAGGVMLAFFGRTYRTGICSWEFFLAWYLLTLPFFLLTRGTVLGLILWITGSFSLALFRWPGAAIRFWSGLPFFEAGIDAFFPLPVDCLGPLGNPPLARKPGDTGRKWGRR